MNFIRLLLLFIPLMFISTVQAQSSPDLIDPGTGTFPMSGQMGEEERDREAMEDREQLEMEKEEADVDSFGEDKYNQNVDPDAYKKEIQESDEIMK